MPDDNLFIYADTLSPTDIHINSVGQSQYSISDSKSRSNLLLINSLRDISRTYNISAILYLDFYSTMRNSLLYPTPLSPKGPIWSSKVGEDIRRG